MRRAQGKVQTVADGSGGTGRTCPLSLTRKLSGATRNSGTTHGSTPTAGTPCGAPSPSTAISTLRHQTWLRVHVAHLASRLDSAPAHAGLREGWCARPGAAPIPEAPPKDGNTEGPGCVGREAFTAWPAAPGSRSLRLVHSAPASATVQAGPARPARREWNRGITWKAPAPRVVARCAARARLRPAGQGQRKATGMSNNGPRRPPMPPPAMHSLRRRRRCRQCRQHRRLTAARRRPATAPAPVEVLDPPDQAKAQTHTSRGEDQPCRGALFQGKSADTYTDTEPVVQAGGKVGPPRRNRSRREQSHVHRTDCEARGSTGVAAMRALKRRQGPAARAQRGHEATPPAANFATPRNIGKPDASGAPKQRGQ